MIGSEINDELLRLLTIFLNILLTGEALHDLVAVVLLVLVG